MKFLALALLFTFSVHAEDSIIAPILRDAARLYVEGADADHYYLQPNLRNALTIFKNSGVDTAAVERRVLSKSGAVLLREDDEFDSWKKDLRTDEGEAEYNVQASKIKIVNTSDFWLKDEVYAYFLITDGVIPTGKVTSIYKGIGNNQGFFFNQADRALFPLTGVPAQRPRNHLIIDYGIIESDGDDIKDLQKLSSIIIDIAIAVYSAYDPENAEILINLRKEIKALTEMLLNQNTDDRLATGTLGYKNEDLDKLLKSRSFLEVEKKHKDNNSLNSWEYRINFRLLKN
jgi:hypothetical protein